MSRPSITAPSAPRRRCASRIRARTGVWRATSETWASTSAPSSSMRGGEPSIDSSGGTPSSNANLKLFIRRTSASASPGSTPRSSASRVRARYINPVLTYARCRARASPRASVDFPLPAAPSMAMTRAALIALMAAHLDRCAQRGQRGGEPRERDLGRFHAVDLARPLCGEGAHRERHRHAVVPVRVRGTARQPAARKDEILTLYRRVAAQRGDPLDDPSQAIALLDAKLARAQEPTVARRVRRHERQDGTSSITSGSSSACTVVDRTRAPAATLISPTGSPSSVRRTCISASDAHALHHVEEVQARRVEPYVGDRERRAGDAGGRDEEGGRRRVARTTGLEAFVLERRDPDRAIPRPRSGPPGPPARVRCGRGWRRARSTVVGPSAAIAGEQDGALDLRAGHRDAVVDRRAGLHPQPAKGHGHSRCAPWRPSPGVGSRRAPSAAPTGSRPPSVRCENGTAAITPASRRIAVPELPQSRLREGATSPSRPSP